MASPNVENRVSSEGNTHVYVHPSTFHQDRMAAAHACNNLFTVSHSTQRRRGTLASSRVSLAPGWFQIERSNMTQLSRGASGMGRELVSISIYHARVNGSQQQPNQVPPTCRRPGAGETPCDLVGGGWRSLPGSRAVSRLLDGRVEVTVRAATIPVRSR